MHAQAETLIDNAVADRLTGSIDRVVERMKPDLDEWIEVLKVSPQAALEEAMEIIDATLKHPVLSTVADRLALKKHAETRLRNYLGLVGPGIG